MTANKSSKAVPRAGGGKAPRDVPDRSVTCGTVVGWLMCTLPVTSQDFSFFLFVRELIGSFIFNRDAIYDHSVVGFLFFHY